MAQFGTSVNGLVVTRNFNFDPDTRPFPNAVTADGQLMIGSTAAPNIKVGTLTAGTGISIANGSGSITISSAASVPTTFTEDTGTATPSANNLNLLGSGSITTTGSGSTVTTSLTGLTNHAVLVGAGTSTITKVGPTATAGQVLQSAGSSADPVFSTATYPATTTISQILYSSATNVVSGLATTNRGVLTTGTTGVPVVIALATDGQLIIGSTAGAPAAATLTAGTGISITNGSNSISIAANGAGFPWTDQGSSTTVASNHGYFVTGNFAETLPAAPAQGDVVKITADTASVVTVTANTGQVIRLGSSVTASAGSIASTAIGDTISLVYRTSGAAWIAESAIGNWSF